MKFVYYMRGFGCGILVAVMIMLLAGAAKSKVKTSETTASDNQSVITTTKENKTEPETTTAAQPETTTAAQPETTTVAQPESTTAAQPESTTAAQPETTTTAAPETTTAVQPAVGDVIIYLDPSYEQSEQVVALLHEKGIIEDEDAFNAYLNETGLAYEIQYGEKTVNPAMSFEEIAIAICN